MISTAQLGRAAYAGAVFLSLVAAVLAAVTLTTAALSVVCVAIGLLSFAIWISNRRLARLITKPAGRAGVDAQPLLTAVADVAAQLRDLPIVTQQSTVVTEIVSRLESALIGQGGLPGANSELARIEALANAQGLRYQSVMTRLNQIDTEVQKTPGLTVELERLSRRLGAGDHPMPVPGGWALTAETLVALVSEVIAPPGLDQVVECGSGTSTVWTALAMRQRGSGHVTALEHDRHYADVTRAQLRALGLEDWATVLDAPLQETTVDGTSARWYDVSSFDALPATIDLLFVDGPPGDTQPLARRPAWFLLAPRLREGSVVILDDTSREDERKTAEDWLNAPIEGRHLAERAKVGRSTVFDVQVAQPRA